MDIIVNNACYLFELFVMNSPIDKLMIAFNLPSSLDLFPP